jgi:hypothetical protein
MLPMLNGPKELSELRHGIESIRSRNGRGRVLGCLGAWLAVALFAVVTAGAVSAADEVESNTASAEVADSGPACPELTEAKYPWSKCGAEFALGFDLGADGEAPPSQCRLHLPNGICAATTEPWNEVFAGLTRLHKP